MSQSHIASSFIVMILHTVRVGKLQQPTTSQMLVKYEHIW